MRLHKNGTMNFVSLTTVMILTSTRQGDGGLQNISMNIGNGN